MKTVKEEVMERLVDRKIPDNVLAFYEDSEEGMRLSPGDNIEFGLKCCSVLIRNTSEKAIFVRGE
jgi:hypothetical protein